MSDYQPSDGTVLSNIETDITSIVNTGLKTAITKTIQTELLGITQIAADAQQISSVLDVTDYKNATIFIDHARDIANAFVGAGTEYRIQVSQKETGNDTWRTIASVVCDITAASSITTDGIEAAGQTLIEIGATTPAIGDIVFFKHGTLSLSEWARVVAINAGVTFTIADALTNTQPQQTMFNKAEEFVLNLSLASIKRIRVAINNANGTTNRAIVSRVAIITQE